MTFRFIRCALASILVLLSCLAVAEESETKSYSLPNRGSIQLKVPKSWQSNIAQPPDNLPPTIQLAPRSAPSFRVLITPLWAAKPGIVLPGPVEMRRNVEQAAERARPQAVEKNLPIRELKGPSVVGYYFEATDRAPGPDEYRYMAQGMFRLGELLVTFTVLTNDDSRSVSGETIAMLENAVHVKDRSSSPSAAANPAREDAIQIIQRSNDYWLAVPVSRLAMSLPKGGLSRKNGPSNHPRYFYFEDPALHLIVSGWFEPEQEFAGVKEVWSKDTRAWRRSGLPEPRGVSFTKIDKWDAVVYDMEVPGGTNAHIRAHWVQAGTWIDIHLSITSNESSQNARARLESLLKSIAVTEKQ